MTANHNATPFVNLLPFCTRVIEAIIVVLTSDVAIARVMQVVMPLYLKSYRSSDPEWRVCEMEPRKLNFIGVAYYLKLLGVPLN